MTEPKVEVVISGIGGLFPESNNLDELKQMLFDKKNGVTTDSRRWIPGVLGTPHGVGKIRTPEKFDNVFFGIHRKMAESLDALTRLSLERSIEAIVDAGINPADLSGTNTAVFMNSCISESEFFEVFDTQQKGFGLLGHNRAMQANRLSYTLNLNGPSYTTDATWIGGSQAIMRAKRMIEDGVINAAIIGSCSLCLNPNISLQLEGLGRLTSTNETRSYSEDANGMNRSESCVVVLLQKLSEAKRSYATLLSATSLFGETNDLFYHYSDHLYKEVLLNAYKEANVDPAKVAYIEGEGLGIKKIDAMELNVLSEVFCTPNRIEPLKVGSIKSNIGHCEATSSLVSLAKALIVLDSGYIPPNINYSEPNQDCPALFSGRLEVVTEKTPLKGNIVGISSFGLCNSFSHVVLKQNKKNKVKIYEKGEMFEDGLPRIVFVSGRNEEGVTQFLERIKNSRMDEEFAALLHSVFYKSMNAHYYRSFTIVPDNEGSQEEISYLPALIKRPIWFVFSGMGSQWNGMGKQLLKIPIFAESVRKLETILKPKGVDLIDILTNEDPTLFDNILNSFVGIAAIQIGLLDVLKSIDVVPDGIIGHSVGELGCAYADGCFTAEQMILAAHARGRASIETELIDGSMAAIGLGYNDIKDRLPHDIEVACHNASDSSTLSGPTVSVTNFVEQLKSEGVFAKLVNVSNIAYHSQYIKPAAPTLLKYLKEVIPQPKPRSSKWVSSSVPESEWGNDVAKYSSPEYHTNNLLGQVLFEEASRHIPEDAIVIEIAPHGLLQAILKRSLSEKVTNIPLTHRSTKDSVKFLLTAFGKMYNNGMTPNIESFYPSINYPVSRETQSLHSLFPWDHKEEWSLKSMAQSNTRISGERMFTIHLNNEHILFDYKIKGRHILPSSILLFHVWKSFITIQSEIHFDEIIAFEELHFLRTIEIKPNEKLEFYSLIQCGSGHFEICLENEVIVSGKIFRPDSIDMTLIKPKMKYPDTVSDVPHSSISKYDLYSLLEHNGYELGETFQTVTNIDLYFEEYRGNIKWDDDWMTFLNGIFTFLIHQSMETNDNPTDVSTIRKMYIDPSKFKDSVGKDVSIYYNFNTNEINGDGIYILHPETKSFSISTLNPFELRLEEENFVQLANPNSENEINFINHCLQVIFECKKFQSNPNMNNFKVYYSNNDKKMYQFAIIMKQMLDIQIGIQHAIVSLDKINTKKFINNDHNIIIIPYDQMSNVISFSKNAKRVHLLVISEKPIFSTKEWSVIMQQQFNGHYLVLIKKIKEIKIISLKLESITDIQNVYEKIKHSLAECKKTKSYLYIFTKDLSYVKLTRFMEEVLHRNKSNKIRFVFLLDNSGPDFNIDHSFYSEHLRKQLFVNIYKDNKWGTIVRNLVDNYSSFNVSVDDKITTYLNDVTLDDLELKYLGINFLDISVNNNIVDKELGHFEYSGITANGKKVMGIAPIGKNSFNKISPDPYLTWTIPSDQALEDAATIPLSYSMAYYMLSILKSSSDNIFDKTILVNAGFNAIGQATIAVALSLGYCVFVTVENKEQSALLKNKFASLSESRIFSYHDNFEVKIKMATNGKGVSIIVNCLHGHDFHASVRSIAHRGIFFQLTKTDMKNKDKIGMLVFLKNIIFYGVSPDRLLAETSEIKLKIQNEVQKGINLGIVKPFDRKVLTGSCTTDQAMKSLHLSSQGVEYNRVVLALEEGNTLEKSLKESEFEKYQCYSNRVYLIIGSKYSTWIDIAEWMVMRGARKIVVALKKYSMSTTASRRFNLLISRYKDTMIQIVSDSNLNSKEDLILLLNDTTAIYPLGAVFFATLSDEEDKIRNIQYVLENVPSFRDLKPLFVCIMSGGENTCIELRANGVCPNTICLSWSLMVTEPYFANLIPSFDKLLINVAKMSSSTIICTEYDRTLIASREYYSKIIAELPETVEELITFGDTVTEEIKFTEVTTNSPRFTDSVGLPVFIVTGFLPKKMKKFYENLMYPAFEARLPETIESIEHVARILVQKLKSITKCGNVSLIGISWGGAVCVLMAQLLEADNIAVSLTLLEGIPNVIQEWTKSLLQYGNINAKLSLNYFQISSMMAREISTKNGWNTELPKILSSNNVLAADKALKALNAIRSRLNAILDLRPLSNKIIAKVKVVYRTTNIEKSKMYKLEDYCVRIPEIISINEKDYDNMLSERTLSRFVNNNILHYHPDANEISITELYKRSELNTVGFVVN
uniref:Fatty acid synthase n=1 Tax=Schizaphis graminum TaxID=13262 RepID=A0A2S2P8N0_SCHGA